MEIIVSILVLILAVTLYVCWNLYSKVIKQEDIIVSQIEYLRKISLTIQESKLYVEQLDEKGIFRADDEVGTFFNFMKEIQELINTYRLPDGYGEDSK